MKKFTERDLIYAIDRGIINEADVQNKMESMKREQILKEHGNKIRKIKGGYYFRIQDKANGEYRRRNKDKHVLEDLLVQYYRDSEKRKQESETKENESFEQLFFEFMEYKKTKVAHDTVRRMMTDWNRYYVPREWFINKPFKQITKIDVDNFLDDVASQNGGIQNKAYCNMKGVLKQTFEYAIDADYIDRSPYRDKVNKKKIIPTRKKDSKKEVFTEQEHMLLLADMERRLAKTPTNSIPLAIMFDFETGLRLGELLALKESDIITENNGIKKIHICRQVVKKHDMSDINNIKGNIWTVANYTKSDCGDRYVPLTDVALEYIKRIIDINKQNKVYNDDYLFLTKTGTIITECSVDSQLRNACDKVGILQRSMHKIRKSYASYLYRNGVQIPIITKMLGHADEATTMKYYIFDVEDSQETDTMVLNALSNANSSNTTTSCKKTGTNGDNKIVMFQSGKKVENLSKFKVSHS